MHSKFFIGIILCFSICCYAQQPAYYILGENQFKGVQIYDIIQDNDLNYLFATNEGLFYFDYYSYQKIEIEDSKSNSVFNFVPNKNGDIFCNNLNNQVFKIRNKKCTLFYELKKDEISPDISLCINNNCLLIGAKKIIRISESGHVVNRFSVNSSLLGQPFQYNTQTTFFHLGSKDSILKVSDSTFSVEKLNVYGLKIDRSGLLQFFKIGPKHFAIKLNSKTLYEYTPETLKLSEIPDKKSFARSSSIRLYNSGSDLWVAGTLPGIIKLNGDSKAPDDLLYGDYFISDVYKDKEGNILLSTFDKGIIVIPDLEEPDVIRTFENDLITSMYYDNKLALLLGSSKGSLFSSNNKTISAIPLVGTFVPNPIFPVLADLSRAGLKVNTCALMLLSSNLFVLARHQTKCSGLYSFLHHSINITYVVQQFFLQRVFN